MSVCAKFQLSSWSRSDWKVCVWVGWVGSRWVLCLTQRSCFYSCFGLSWVELRWVLTIIWFQIYFWCSRTFQTPFKHLPDTFKAPSIYIPDTFQITFRHLLEPSRYHPETLLTPSRHLPGTFQTPSRHLQDTFQTPSDNLQTPTRNAPFLPVKIRYGFLLLYYKRGKQSQLLSVESPSLKWSLTKILIPKSIGSKTSFPKMVMGQIKFGDQHLSGFWGPTPIWFCHSTRRTKLIKLDL